VAGEATDFVTWGALHWLIGIFGTVLAGAWAILTMLIGSKGTKEMQEEIKETVDNLVENSVTKAALASHFEDDKKEFGETNLHIHEVEQRAERSLKETVDRLEKRIERSEDRIIDAIKKNGH
jgi:biopolymer transport protein ExbB/TolQ